MQTIFGKDVLTTGEVARICHVAPRTVSKWVDTGKLPGYRIPGRGDRRVPAGRLEAFMRAHRMPLDDLSGGCCRVMVLDRNADAGALDALRLTGRYDLRATLNGFDGSLSRPYAPAQLAGAIAKATSSFF